MGSTAGAQKAIELLDGKELANMAASGGIFTASLLANCIPNAAHVQACGSSSNCPAY